MKVLVLGASGMLGNTTLRVMCENDNWNVSGTVRSKEIISKFPNNIASRIIDGVDVSQTDRLEEKIHSLQPDVVINCIGITKQIDESDDPLFAIPINALLPHQLEKMCADISSRLIHISTDCVFSGEKGNYIEDDFADARDLYGLSKYLGELHSNNTVTLRTSIIGHELNSNNGIVEWFLSQENNCKGYTRAIFSGLTTVELARIIRDIVIPNKNLMGLYHVAANVISKFDLLNLIAEVYGKRIDITQDEQVIVDRSLNAEHFNRITNYSPPSWTELIKIMNKYH